MGVDIKRVQPVNPPIKAVVVQETPYVGIRLTISQAGWIRVEGWDRTDGKNGTTRGHGLVKVTDIDALIDALIDLKGQLNG